MVLEGSSDPYRMNRRRLLRGAAGAAGAFGILGLAGCGSSSSSGSAASGTPKRGGVIEFAVGSTLVNESCDPQHTFDANEDILTATLYEKLCEMDTKWTAQPKLATSWQPNTALTEWTFVMRDNVTFHDGQPFTSADAAYTLRRILDPKLGSILQPSWNLILDPGGITTPDPRHLVLKLKAPSGMPPILLSYRGCEIVPENSSSYLAKRANGTGPFKLRSFVAGQSWEVERNPHYWMKGLPYLDGIRETAATDAAAKVQAVLSGTADVTDTIDYTLAKTVTGNPMASLIRDRGRIEMFIVTDVRHKPFDDNRVRTALKLAMDRQAIANTALQGYGILTSDTVVPQGDPFYPPNLGIRKRNIEQAKQLLSQAGYPNGIEVELQCANIIGGMVDMNTAISQTVAEAGINLHIKQTPAESYYVQVWRQVPIFNDWIVHRHPAVRLPLTFTSNAIWPESHYPNTPLDGMQDEINLKPDDPTVYAAPLTWIANNEGYYNPALADGLTVRKNRVHDLRIRTAGDYDFQWAWVD
jgi:peptide/nickel transport system substrate-binding protein